LFIATPRNEDASSRTEKVAAAFKIMGITPLDLLAAPRGASAASSPDQGLDRFVDRESRNISRDLE
jgi:hypothetical protein